MHGSGRVDQPAREQAELSVAEAAPPLVKVLLRAGHASINAVLVDYDLDDGKGDALVLLLMADNFAGRITAISSQEDGNRALLAAGAHACCPQARFQEIGSLLEARR